MTRGSISLLVKATDSLQVTRTSHHPLIVVDFDDIYDVILGMPWLEAVDPLVRWKQHKWRFPIEEDTFTIVRTKAEARRATRDSSAIYVLACNPIGASTVPKKIWPMEEYAEYKDVFSLDGAISLPRHPSAEHPIELTEGGIPPYGPIYPLAPNELEALREYLEMAQERGWIRPSTSPAGAPIIFVPKKGGKLRLCVDYRGLNKITVKNRAPLPLISEILDRLGSATIYTKLDLKDAYHRMRIREGDEWKTAFRTRYGHFEYLVLPFGLVNAPATFQTYINNALAGLVDTICIVYLDDILIFSEKPEDHQQHVRSVLERLQQARLFANPEKCEFHTNEVQFLGFVVSPQGIRMEEERVAAITTWKEPATVKELLVFLGFTGFYRRFICGYSKIAAPLTDLLKGRNGGPIQMDPRARLAFRTLRTAFAIAPILQHFDPALPICLETDASAFAIGAILSQLHGDRWHPVAFLSRKLAGAELRYDTADAELLAIVEAFRAWRHYLSYTQHQVVVLTDHLNHRYLATKSKLNGRQARWLNELSPYDFVIEYQEGRKNPADGLSRKPELEDNDKEVQQQSTLPAFLDKFVSPFPASVSVAAVRTGHTEYLAKRRRGCPPKTMIADPGQPPTVSLARMSLRRNEGTATAQPTPEAEDSETSLLDAIRIAQEADPFVTDKQYQEQNSTAAEGAAPWATNHLSLLCRNGATYIPQDSSLCSELIRAYHDSPTAGHLGATKTLKSIQLSYFWNSMRREVNRYVAACPVCQKTKPRHHKPYGMLQPLPIPDRPWQEISMDFITGLPKARSNSAAGYDSILVIVDRLTKFALYLPTSSSLTAGGLATILTDRVFTTFGIPSGIVSDRGSLFTSKFWRTLCDLLVIRRRLSTAFHPQTDGQTERLNQLLEHYLRVFCNEDQSDWVAKLPLAQFVYNTSHHSSINTTPSFALMGYHPQGPFDVKPTHHQRRSYSVAAKQRAEQLEADRKKLRATLAHSQELYKKYYDKGRKPMTFQKGDWVLLSAKNIHQKRPSKKLSNKYLGPFRVVRSIAKHGLAYELDLPTSMRIHNVFPVSLLEPYKGREGEDPSTLQDAPIMPDEVSYEVEMILDHKGTGKNRWFYVRWKGYPPSEDSWEPRSAFDDGDMIVQYEAQLAQKKRGLQSV